MHTSLPSVYDDALKNQVKTVKTKKGKQELEEKIDKLVEKTTKTFKKAMEEEGCIGSISELYDSVKPQLPKGAFAQGWSVAQIFKIILKK